MLFVFPIAVFAAELPPLPDKPTKVAAAEHDCRETLPLEAGTALVCDAIAVPPYRWVNLANRLAWCDAVVERYEDDTRYLLTQQESCEWRLDRTEAQLQAARLPVPLNERPSPWLALGVVAGGTFAVAMSWASTYTVR